MSCIFGYIQLYGSTSDLDLLPGMLRAAENWQPDSARTLKTGQIAFGHCLLRNTPESFKERQPLVSESRGAQLVMIADARLDCRNELASKLGIPREVLNKLSDPELLLEAWCRWDEHCTEHLLGDLAFVVWDDQKQALYCIRDHVGIRPLYYAYNDQIVAFASDINVLLTTGCFSAELNDDAIASYLGNWCITIQSHTFLRDIKRLPPATILRFSRNGEKEQSTYWQPEAVPMREGGSTQESVKELRTLLKCAVNDRLRSKYPVFSHLSGGLDSSCISVLAARKLAERNQILRSYNWINASRSDDDPRYFEWGFAAQLAQKECIELKNVELSAAEIYADLIQTDISLGYNADAWYEKAVQAGTQEGGGRTLLSGWGGDDFASHNGIFAFHETFWGGTILESLQLIASNSRGAKKPVKRFFGFLWAMVFRTKLAVLMPSMFSLGGKDGIDCNPCVNEEFMGKVKRYARPERDRPRDSGRSKMLDLLSDQHLQHRIENWASTAWETRIEYAYPLLDRRIIEFALATPPKEWRQNGYGRFLFREANKDILPENVRLHSLKDEPVRVKELKVMTLQALEDFYQELNSCNSGSLHRRTNKYIDLQKFGEQLRKLAAMDGSDQFQENMLFLHLINAARILRIGNRENGGSRSIGK